LVIMVEPDGTVLDFQQNLFADHGMRKQITVGLIGNQTVPVYLETFA
jgi:hypothetical protein